MSLLPRFLPLVACLVSLSLPLTAEVLPVDEVLRQVDVLMANREDAKKAISSRLPPMPDSHMNVLVDRIVFMFRDPKFREAFKRKFPQGIEGSMATQAGFDFVLELLSKGLRLLPEADQLEFVRFTREYMGFLTPEECKLIIAAPRLNASLAMETEMRYSATLPIERFTVIQTLYRDSSMAVLYGRPAAVTLTPEETQAANAALAQLLKQAVAKMPPDVLAKFTDLPSAPAEALCELTLDLFEGMLNLEPAARRKVVRVFLDSMARPL